MKYFNTVMEIFAHRPRCPICSSKIYSHDILNHKMDKDQDLVDILINSNTVIEVNCNDNIIHKLNATYDEITSSTKTYTPKRYINNLGPVLSFFVLFSCPRFCYQYKVHLLAEVSQQPYHIKSASLVREFIALNHSSSIRVISNNYASEVTMCQLRSQKIIEIPLINLDLNNPSDIFERAKKLIVFS